MYDFDEEHYWAITWMMKVLIFYENLVHFSNSTCVNTSFEFFHLGGWRIALNKYKCNQIFSLTFEPLITSLQTCTFDFHVLSLLLECYWLG